MTDPAADEDPANGSTTLTALADAKARVRIDAAERDPDTVGHLLAAYRTREGLTEQELAARLGISLLSLAGLAEELRPGVGVKEMGLEALADLYQANHARLLEAFDLGAGVDRRARWVQAVPDDGLEARSGVRHQVSTVLSVGPAVLKPTRELVSAVMAVE
jgi:transcriptional regulator with XRE-family HTH domain